MAYLLGLLGLLVRRLLTLVLAEVLYQEPELLRPAAVPREPFLMLPLESLQLADLGQPFRERGVYPDTPVRGGFNQLPHTRNDE